MQEKYLRLKFMTLFIHLNLFSLTPVALFTFTYKTEQNFAFLVTHNSCVDFDMLSVALKIHCQAYIDLWYWNYKSKVALQTVLWSKIYWSASCNLDIKKGSHVKKKNYPRAHKRALEEYYRRHWSVGAQWRSCMYNYSEAHRSTLR